MITLAGKTIFISGASRGIGHAIALRAARDGANIIVAAKTIEGLEGMGKFLESAADAFQQADEQLAKGLGG